MCVCVCVCAVRACRPGGELPVQDAGAHWWVGVCLSVCLLECL